MVATARSRAQSMIPADFGCGAGDGLFGGAALAVCGLEPESGIEGSFEAVSISIQITRNRRFLHLQGIAKVNTACRVAAESRFCIAKKRAERGGPRVALRSAARRTPSHGSLVMPLSVDCSVTAKIV